MTIAAATKVAKRLATGNFGYGQDDRTSALADNGKMGVAGLREPGDTDCSFSLGIIYYLGGLIDRAVLRGAFYSGNIVAKLVATGMFTATRVKGWSLAKLRAFVREGDAVAGPGHVVYGLGGGRIVSFESTERGTSTGGKKGDQTGREGRIRDLYARPKGWSYVVRPIAPQTFMGRVLAAYAAGKSTADHLAKLSKRSPFDGPRWAWFVKAWSVLDWGMALAYDPAALVDVPTAGHAFVVLGSGLPKDGSVGGKYRRRLQLALDASVRFPASKIIVTGGEPQNGVTEAEAGLEWLAARGVDPARIITEEQAASTIGNAKYSVPIMRKAGVTSYTLVSDASHLRRASVLFLAARLQVETAENVVLALEPATPLAFDDYAPAPVKTASPVTAATRQAITDEVASLLGVSAQYKAAK